MAAISISNIKIKGLKPMDFYNNPQYKDFNVHDGSSTLVPFYQELLREVLGSKVDERFQDYALTPVETQQIQTIFERELDKKAKEYKPTGKLPHKDIVYKGKTYALDLRLTSPIGRRMNDYFTIIQICKECLEEEKPMYISIE